jgi:hypothetical protein
MGYFGRIHWAASFLLVLALAARAGADGCFFGKAGHSDIAEPEQKAVIHFERGVEDLVLQIAYDGAVDEFAWLVPLPSKPEVSAVDGKLFEELRQYVFARSEWRVYREQNYSFGNAGGFRGRQATFGGGHVTVHERKKVGIYDVAVLSAETIEDLVDWCSQHGFRVSNDARAVLGSYVKRGWTFTAMRIHPEERSSDDRVKALRQGSIQTMRFTFRSKEAIYPLKISSINRGATDVLLYVFARDNLVHPAFTPRHPPSPNEFHRYLADLSAYGKTENTARFGTYFDAMHSSYRTVIADELPITRDTLPRWGRTPLHLTALQQTFESESMDDDIVLNAPEQLDREQKKAFVRSCIGGTTPLFDKDKQKNPGADGIVVDAKVTPEPLLLRIPNALVEVTREKLARSSKESNYSQEHWSHNLRLLFMLAETDTSKVSRLALLHPRPEVRNGLIDALDTSFFTQDYSCLDTDEKMENERCWSYEPPRDRYGENMTYFCGSRRSLIQGVSAPDIEELLADLFVNGRPIMPVANMLATLDTQKSISLLRRAALGLMDEDSRVDPSRRGMALNALRHVKRPEMTTLYMKVFEQQRGSLNPNDISCILAGLWTNNDPQSASLIRRIEVQSHKLNQSKLRGRVQNLLVNRLRARGPQVAEGMNLSALEIAMAAPGEEVHKMLAAGEKVVQYRWNTGVATVKGDVVVKWKAQ